MRTDITIMGSDGRPRTFPGVDLDEDAERRRRFREQDRQDPLAASPSGLSPTAEKFRKAMETAGVPCTPERFQAAQARVRMPRVEH